MIDSTNYSIYTIIIIIYTTFSYHRHADIYLITWCFHNYIFWLNIYISHIFKNFLDIPPLGNGYKYCINYCK